MQLRLYLGMNMICHYVDERHDFFALLAEKLGGEFAFARGLSADREQLVHCDVIVVGLPSPARSEFPERIQDLQTLARNPLGVPVIAFLATHERHVALKALMAGAYDHFVESGSLDELRVVLRRAAQFHEMNRELQRLRISGLELGDFMSIIGCDRKMRAVFTLASKVAATDATILITGETGTGKELLAKAIHQASPRSRQPFVAVACSSLPETLIEAELFGHERGAFTGAASSRRGRFEAAESGTIFLDEIGELSPGLQVKLLRVLQERTFERLGSNQPKHMDARIVCATNRDLQTEIKAGAFRADLYYRLNTIELSLPPLRERRDDVAVLAHTFVQVYAEKHQRPANRICRAAISSLQEYDWPGNVRELQNVIERAVVICDGGEIGVEHLPSQFAAWEVPDDTCSFDDEVRSFKRRLIQRALSDTNNNKLQAARTLKIARSSLHRLIDELDIRIADRKDVA